VRFRELGIAFGRVFGKWELESGRFPTERSLGWGAEAEAGTAAEAGLGR
jgi:hypothetical protein